MRLSTIMVWIAAIVVIDVSGGTTPAAAVEAVNAEWHGILSAGWGPETTQLGLKLDGAAPETDFRLSLDWTGFGLPEKQQKGSLGAALSREIPRWRLSAEAYGSVVGAEATADGARRTAGLDLSALDRGSGRPAVLEGGARLRQFTYPGRSASNYRETGYFVKTGFRLDDAPSALWESFDPTWLTGLAGLAGDSRAAGEDLPLLEWFIGTEVDPRARWFAGLAAGTDDSAQAHDLGKRVFTATVWREYSAKDYTADDGDDSESHSDTVTLTEKLGDLAVTLQQATTGQVYQGASAKTYLLRELTLRAGRSSKAGAGSAEPSRAWEIEAGLDGKEYPYDSLKGYTQARGAATHRWRRPGQQRRVLEVQAEGRWREYFEGGRQRRVAAEATVAGERGRTATEWRLSHSLLVNSGPGADGNDHRTIRLRATRRHDLTEQLTFTAGFASEYDAERGVEGGWGGFHPETVVHARLEMSF